VAVWCILTVQESRQRIASEHPEIVSMRNKAANTAKASGRRGGGGLGKGAAGKDSAEEGERIRIDEVRTKVTQTNQHTNHQLRTLRRAAAQHASAGRWAGWPGLLVFAAELIVYCVLSVCRSARCCTVTVCVW
jgi:hypothetical protein